MKYSLSPNWKLPVVDFQLKTSCHTNSTLQSRPQSDALALMLSPVLQVPHDPTCSGPCWHPQVFGTVAFSLWGHTYLELISPSVTVPHEGWLWEVLNKHLSKLTKLGIWKPHCSKSVLSAENYIMPFSVLSTHSFPVLRGWTGLERNRQQSYNTLVVVVEIQQF